MSHFSITQFILAFLPWLSVTVKISGGSGALVASEVTLKVKTIFLGLSGAYK